MTDTSADQPDPQDTEDTEIQDDTEVQDATTDAQDPEVPDPDVQQLIAAQDEKHTEPAETTAVEQPQPTPEDVATWTAAIQEIMARDGVTEEEANAGLVWALIDFELQQNIRELARARDEDLWAEVIVSLMYRNPTWTEQEANDNLVNLLQWVEAHPGESYPPEG